VKHRWEKGGKAAAYVEARVSLDMPLLHYCPPQSAKAWSLLPCL